MEVLKINIPAKAHLCQQLQDYPRINDPAPLGSYPADDVIFLLKDIGPLIQEQGNEERERAMQSGRHYSEMLPIEYKPNQEYIDLFHQALKETSYRLALATAIVAETILNKRGRNVVLVSLARAGTPVGVLIKRYIKHFYGINAPHYSISIIRDKGIDKNALLYILQRHMNYELQFIDGWTGKGTITRELLYSIAGFAREFGLAENTICQDIAVLADPGCCANIFGTRDDFLIPSACLNATISGLVSRTIYRDDLVGPADFHGVKFYRELAGEDLSNYFVDSITGHFNTARIQAQHLLTKQPAIGVDQRPAWRGRKETKKIMAAFGIKNINLVKPGVGETTRVLLRRVPWKILVKDMASPNIKHVLILAQARGVQVIEYPDMSYSCYGLIQPMGDN
ncbi:PELOTA RNA binding domain-containing protein [Desulfotomaculum arcticum]|uniref:PELOTA RNA binding domain-containing protein n=1 Tax=Desulfotruncus arcticus DSM 17038 TaxID=1121424 RepID=A0A1I2PF24_9FIRM|nr:PELOTA RNA binding domain-containing protein [Desulfotomaculum arcticum] [Desulfotruncus arcticus DSM 17038]